MTALCALAVLWPAAGAGAARGAAAPEQPGQVSLVHGLRGMVADVYLDGKLVLQTFQPERTTKPFALMPGHHKIEVRTAGMGANTPPAVSGTVDVKAGARMSAVVYASSSGEPDLKVYDDDVSPVPRGKSRVEVRVCAVTQPIDIFFDMQRLGSAVPAEGSVHATYKAATYTVYVRSAGKSAALIPPHVMPLPAGTANFMYLIGTESNHDLEWTAETVTGLQKPPANLPMGAPAPAPSPRPAAPHGSTLAVAALLLSALLVAVSGRAPRARARSRDGSPRR